MSSRRRYEQIDNKIILEACDTQLKFLFDQLSASLDELVGEIAELRAIRKISNRLLCSDENELCEEPDQLSSYGTITDRKKIIEKSIEQTLEEIKSIILSILDRARDYEKLVSLSESVLSTFDKFSEYGLRDKEYKKLISFVATQVESLRISKWFYQV